MPRVPLLLASLIALAASPVLAGPPWIAIEYPANPHHASTRGAALLVRAYHHSTSVTMPVSGTAEGIVAGKRTSRRLDLRPTNMPGVYALRGDLPQEGAWVLAISIEQGKDDTATALVTLDGRGGIARVEVPVNSRDGWTVPRAVKPEDITRALQVAVAVANDGAGRGPDAVGSPAAAERTPLLAGALGLPLLLVALARRRSRRSGVSGRN